MKNSKLCIAGFICAFVPVLIYIIVRIIDETLNNTIMIAGWLGLVSAIVLSITGMIRDKKKKIGFGVAGFTIALVQMIPWFLLTAVIWII